MASDDFIQFQTPNVTGESTDDQHKQWSEVMSWSLSSGHPAWAGDASAGTGRSAGKVQFSDFSFSKYLDSATDDLLSAMWPGTHFATVTFESRRAGAKGDKYVYLQIVMNEVLVTGHSIAAGGGDSTPTESWTLNFAKIKFTYIPQKDDGTADAKQPASWDLTTNKVQGGQ